MIKVYIASPYTQGDIAANVRRSMDAFDELARLGFAPYSPLLSHFQQIVHPLDYGKWLELDLEWLRACDCMLRLDGESEGADREVEEAKKSHKLIFYDINSFKLWREAAPRYICTIEEAAEKISKAMGFDPKPIKELIKQTAEQIHKEARMIYDEPEDPLCISKNTGRKDDTDKLRWDLVLWAQLEEVVKVLTHGAIRYGDDNWQKVENARARYSAALMRHFMDWQKGKIIDVDSGAYILAHLICCALFLMWFDMQQEGKK